jgi:hypothetical protein
MHLYEMSPLTTSVTKHVDRNPFQTPEHRLREPKSAAADQGGDDGTRAPAGLRPVPARHDPRPGRRCRARAIDVSITAGRSLPFGRALQEVAQGQQGFARGRRAPHRGARYVSVSLALLVRSAPGSLNWITTSSLKISDFSGNGCNDAAVSTY